MHRILLSLDTFTLLLSFLGLVLPVHTPLRFLFPHIEASLAGLVLTGGAFYAQVRNYAARPRGIKWLAAAGIVLLLVIMERLVSSTDSGFINSRLSHADLFLLAPLAVSYLLTALDRQAVTAVQAARLTGWQRSSRQPHSHRQHHPRLRATVLHK